MRVWQPTPIGPQRSGHRRLPLRQIDMVYGVWCMVYGDGDGDGVEPTCWQRLLKITAGNLQNERTARLLPQF